MSASGDPVADFSILPPTLSEPSPYREQSIQVRAVVSVTGIPAPQWGIAATGPPARAAHKIAYDAAAAKSVMFGGETQFQRFADTWAYDSSSQTWDQRHPATSPAPRSGGPIAYDSDRQRTVLFGGQSTGYF
ncbi:MAG TPA: kelch repeat-containing protein, partial [Thermoplasmata archaeon]|nr:kelch repeat-containing protein [Thermoplasmata archaeon]